MRLSIGTAMVAAVMVTATASRSDAQTFITPFAGATFGGDSGDGRPTVGASVLFMGTVVGAEFEANLTPNFFGADRFDFDTEANVTSLAGNLVLGVGEGPVRPYVTGGIGLLRSRITSPDDFFDEISGNDFGVNGGAGLIVMPSEHVGVRGDVRYFRSVEDVDVGELAISLGGLDFWRAYGGVTFSF